MHNVCIVQVAMHVMTIMLLQLPLPKLLLLMMMMAYQYDDRVVDHYIQQYISIPYQVHVHTMSLVTHEE
jgi:hypothetical protein